MEASEKIWDEWLGELNTWWLYQNPVGTVYRYWLEPARILHLPLILLIDLEGLEISDPNELKLLSMELDRLEEYWYTLDFSGYRPDYLQDRLIERLGFLHEAIQISLEQHGRLCVGSNS